MTGLVPVDGDLDTGGFFEAARRGELAVRRCNGCDALLHLPRAYCKRCGSWDGRWETVAGTGTVYSWSVVEHQVHPAYPVPYTILLVQLDDEPAARFVGHLDGSPDVSIGQPVEAWFDRVDTVDGDTVVPRWRLA
ncbi:Zn-ribbon domain-containing OB-fold protein [Desertimonas flava]|uniref:Zn-ribbon domain-containing OB-fold protein n=1 Tax=Desertimonas flava TaxID=2064846 RepID=UPI000E34F9F3|nr:OB-fold domain-containing protein [Desertimonas flava]